MPDRHTRVDPSRALLVVVTGPDAGRTLVLPHAAVRVGRDPGCDLTLSDDTVGGLALEVVWDGRAALVRNLDPRGPPRFGEARVGEISVGFGAEIRIGRSRLRIQPKELGLELAATSNHRFGTLRGRHERTREVFSVLGAVAPTDLTVLLEGERGTGKELVARTLHEHSKRSKGPYLVVDCASAPRDLMGNLLFGTRSRPGAIARGHTGTLFLREVDHLDPTLQRRLLEALDRQALTGPKPRLVAATCRSLKEEVRADRFREDLYYRLAAVKVTLPPLRDRRDDLPLLVEAFLDGLGADPAIYRRITTPQNIRVLRGHAWPGNARELRTFLAAALAHAGSKEVDVTRLIPRWHADTGCGHDLDDEAFGQSASWAFGAGSRPRSFKEAKDSVIEAFEKQYLEALLHRSDGNVSKASREAGLDRKYLARLMKKHGLASRHPAR